MTPNELHDAIRRKEQQLGFMPPFTPNDISFFPVIMGNLATNFFVHNIEEDNDTKLIREQLQILWTEGALRFD